MDEDDDASGPLNFDEILGRSANPAGETEAFAGEAELVDPEDVAFAPDTEPEPDPMSMFSVEMDDEPEPAPPMPAPAPVAAAPRPTYVPPPMPRPAPRPQPSVAQTAPMPDPTLSSDMAEQLLDTTTQSAVKSTFSRLNGLSMVGTGVTLEAMMRDMLRPMLKEWLDENLPAVVERMVEKEISRISRGGGE
jgi:cell pole-organizing protein PopZ